MSNSGKVRKAKKTPKGRPQPAAPERVLLEGEHHLGQLGKEKPTLALTFGWFEYTLRANPGAGELELAEFLMKSRRIQAFDPEDINESAEAFEVVQGFLKAMVHPDDWDVFWDTAKVKRQETSDLMEAAMAIVEKVTGFPTGQPSASPDGSTPTGPSSTGGSSSLVTRALQEVPGRPDLQAAIFAAARSKESV